MVLLTAAILLLLVLAFVGYPLLSARGRRDSDDQPAARQLEHLLAERERALQAIKELEFEHALGNVPDGEFVSLKAAQRHRVLTILSELDKSGYVGDGEPDSDSALSDRLEAEIALARCALEDASHNNGKPGGLVCPACGAYSPDGAAYCHGCGRPLQATVTCATCGARHARSARRCPGCGARVASEPRQ